MQPTVTIRSTTYSVKTHLGSKKQTNYEIFLNDVRLRGFSTGGNMTEGYWGNRAHDEARKYAEAVASTLQTSVIRTEA